MIKKSVISSFSKVHISDVYSNSYPMNIMFRIETETNLFQNVFSVLTIYLFSRRIDNNLSLICHRPTCLPHKQASFKLGLNKIYNLKFQSFVSVCIRNDTLRNIFSTPLFVDVAAAALLRRCSTLMRHRCLQIMFTQPCA